MARRKYQAPEIMHNAPLCDERNADFCFGNLAGILTELLSSHLAMALHFRILMKLGLQIWQRFPSVDSGHLENYVAINQSTKKCYLGTKIETRLDLHVLR